MQSGTCLAAIGDEWVAEADCLKAGRMSLPVDFYLQKFGHFTPR
jgi:hypothetical protein